MGVQPRKLTAAATAGRAAGRKRSGVKSREALNLARDLLDAPINVRRAVIRELSDRELTVVLVETARETGSQYGQWHDSPTGFVEDICGETVWSKQREVLEAIHTHKRIIVPAGFGVGKCVYGQDVIPLAGGAMMKAEDLVGTEFEVMAWREDGAQVRRRARADWNAVETIYSLTTVSGRRVRRNGHHPLWKARGVTYSRNGRDLFDPVKGGTRLRVPEVDGWTPLSALHPGDLVLVPEKHYAEGDLRVAEHVPRLLGYLLGDGGTSRPSMVTFTQKDGPALDEFRTIVGGLGCELRPTTRPYHYRVVGSDTARSTRKPGVSGAWRNNAVLNAVRDWGLHGKKAPVKSFPAWAWTLPNDQLAAVVGALFACDAWVYVGGSKKSRNSGHVGIALASETMIRDIEFAMLRLGIVGSVRARTVKLDGKTFNSWEWSCRDRRSLSVMADLIDMPGKNEKLRELVERNATRGAVRLRSWQHRNAPPGYRWDQVKTVEELPEPGRTVAIEVDGDHTFVTTLVEHNTHLAGRACAWFVSVNPVGTALVVTTATRLRQVKNQLWPHIRRVHARAGLPGVCDTMQWKMKDEYGNDVPVAYGFSAPEHDEAAMQGIHAIKLLLIVDEAGGISPAVGGGTNNLLTGDARMLAIGNPPMNDPGSWFEQIAMEGYVGEEPGTHTIKIATTDSPAITGEVTPLCRECPTGVPAHRLSRHLPDSEWMDRILRLYGPDHPYVIAKVNADFPKDAGTKIIPATWVELAAQTEDPEGPDYVRPVDLGLPGEDATFTVKKGAWVRLGIDIAADGGDEFAIYRAVGDVLHKRHTSSGAVNANSMTVAEKCLSEILAAEAFAAAIGSTHKVRVKIDTIGVGWGVVGILDRWGRGDSRRHHSVIVPVNVAEKPHQDDESAEMRPLRKRDELWLTGRTLTQPDPTTGEGRLRLRVDEKCLAQLSVPGFGSQGGFVVVESKKAMRKRRMSSPDRAEAGLLALYEPEPVTKRRGIVTGA